MKLIENLVPYPQQVNATEGTYFFDACQPVRVSKAVFDDKAIVHKCATLQLALRCDEQLSGFQFWLGAHTATAQAPQRAEAYCLAVSPQGVSIDGFDVEGLFWGLTTLEQLLNQSTAIPCCVLNDWPAIESRGHFDDISRKRVSTTEDFKQIIRRLSLFKINYYGMYIEDVLHLQAYPDVGEKRGKLMPWEVQEIVAEGELYKVNVVPFFQLLGHCENLLDMPNYAHLGKQVVQKMSSLDPQNPEVRVFLKNCIEEVAALFPCKYFGMGFDETQGLSKEDFVSHANWCAHELEKYGKTGLIWVDMFYNHYGIDKIKELVPSLIPVDWQYGQEGGVIAFWEELKVTNRLIWGFGGYNNWCKFLPDFEQGKDNVDAWIRTVNPGPGSALFYSQWGDNGYENNRDLPWNLFAYAGECSWRGDGVLRETFERRFHIALFGEEIPALLDTVAAAPALHEVIPYWNFHRKNANAYTRIAKHEPHYLAVAKEAQRTIEKLLGKLRLVANEKAAVILHHHITALEIMRVVTQRLIFAFEPQGLPVLIDAIAAARDLSMKDWLLTNRLEGLSVSVDVFNEVIASYQMLMSRAVEVRSGYQPISLDAFNNTYFEDIAGVPIGAGTCAGIPFLFADATKTHLSMQTNTSVTVDVPSGVKQELHLIVSTPMTPGAKPMPALKVSFLKDGTIISEEILQTVTHCVDWFAPFGEHMWAGGGYAYADKTRVTPALRPDLFFGLMSVSGFQIDAEFDQIVFTALAEKNVEIFALTVQ